MSGLERFPDKPHEMSQAHLETLDDGNWIATAKADGWRACSLHMRNGDYQVWSRLNNRLDTNADFAAEIIDALKALDLPPDTILDGEWMRRRAGNKTTVNKIVVWGILRWDGKWLSRITEEERWAMTTTLPLDGHCLELSEHRERGFKAFFEQLRTDPLNEGIVLKHRKSRLILSRNGSKKNPQWVKIKW